MATAVTQGIRVSVIAHYEADQSAPLDDRYLFSYRITIANRSRSTVQLLRRHWHIFDSLAARSEVEGPGVVGAVPVLQPGEQFTYTSFCELGSPLGRMQGSYTMRDLDLDREFDVAIPSFHLRYPVIAN